jgi:hypothetical protein
LLLSSHLHHLLTQVRALRSFPRQHRPMQVRLKNRGTECIVSLRRLCCCLISVCVSVSVCLCVCVCVCACVSTAIKTRSGSRLPVLHAHELLLAAAEQARVGDDVIVETLNASLLEGFSYFFRGLPIVGGLVALSTLISNQVANQVTQVGGSIVSIMGYACHMYRYTHRRKFLFCAHR